VPPPHPGLNPAKPGEVRNPKGINQYTYRGDFERSIDALLKGKLSGPEIEDLKLPDHIRHVVEAGEVTRGEVIAMITVAGAMMGEKERLAEVLARLWPKISKHEIEDTAGTLAALIRAARE